MFDRLRAERTPRHEQAGGKRKTRRPRRRKPSSPRPTRGRERFYSGKKKHTVKHPVVVVRKLKAPGRKGQPRRVRVAAVPGWCARRGCRGPGTRGTRGPGGTPPTRRPRKGSLTARQKAGNRRVSKRRIAADRYRNPRRCHTPMMKNIAGLRNRMFASPGVGGGDLHPWRRCRRLRRDSIDFVACRVV